MPIATCALGQGLRNASDCLRLERRRKEGQQRDDRADGALVDDRVHVLLCTDSNVTGHELPTLPGLLNIQRRNADMLQCSL